MSLSNEIYNSFFEDKKDGIMIEVGAAGPNYLSQSLFFREIGWRCVLIEPNPRFVEEHLKKNNEIYQYACSNFDQDDIDFELCLLGEGEVTNESFSSLYIDEKFVKNSGFSSKDILNIQKIKVNVRKLDTILKELDIKSIDYISIDVEDHEEKVLDGFSIQEYKPKIVLIENNFKDHRYDNYFQKNGYILYSSSGIDYIYQLK